jgi:serine/threonine-protein kinase
LIEGGDDFDSTPNFGDSGDFSDDPTLHADSRRDVGDPLLGRPFKEKFIAEEKIGEGAMGLVYRGRDLSKRPPEQIAIKILKAQESDELGLEARFKREAVLVSKLNHPNTIRFVDWGAEKDGTLYLVTELLTGQPLDKLLEKNPQGIGEVRALEIIDQVAASLEDAHSKGVVHRDIKPANIFVDGDRAKLLDFGIARIAFNGMELSKTFAAKTAAGMAMFTPMYCSPEQALSEEMDHRSDLYSLGVVAYHCLAGKTPFKGGIAGLLESHLSKEPPPIAERTPGVKVNYATEALVRKMMGKRVEDRPQSASEVRAAIADIRGDTRPTLIDLPKSRPSIPAQPARTISTTTAPEDAPPPRVQPPPPPPPPVVPTTAPMTTPGIPRWVGGAIAVALFLIVYLVIRVLVRPT